MTFRYLLLNKYPQKSCLSSSSSFLFLASMFLVLLAAFFTPPVAQAADEPAAIESVSTSDLSLRRYSINMPTGDALAFDARGFHENELLPVFFPAFLPDPGTANTATTSSAIFKTEPWRTNKAVIASSIFAAAWLTADGITTVGMNRGASEGGSVWAYGRHPTAGRTAAMMAAEFVGVEATSYVLHKMRAPKWVYIAPMIVSGSFHASGAIPNMKIGQ
ncbi:MAG: hypothetical protein WA609_08175 [Terriglobales bacterium]